MLRIADSSPGYIRLIFCQYSRILIGRKKITSVSQRAILTRSVGGFAVLEPVRVVAGFQDVPVVSQTIQESSGHLGIAKDLPPFAEGEIGGDDEDGPLVELAMRWKCMAPPPSGKGR